MTLKTVLNLFLLSKMSKNIRLLDTKFLLRTLKKNNEPVPFNRLRLNSTGTGSNRLRLRNTAWLYSKHQKFKIHNYKTYPVVLEELFGEDWNVHGRAGGGGGNTQLQTNLKFLRYTVYVLFSKYSHQPWDGLIIWKLFLTAIKNQWFESGSVKYLRLISSSLKISQKVAS